MIFGKLSTDQHLFLNQQLKSHANEEAFIHADQHFIKHPGP